MWVTNSFVQSLQNANLRPFSSEKDALPAEIPPLYDALKASENLKVLVDSIIRRSIFETKPQNKQATALDLRSVDGMSRQEIKDVREHLLSPNILMSGRVQKRSHTLRVQKFFTGLDQKEYTFPNRDDMARATIMLLNEFYQLAVLGMVREGYTIKPEVHNRIFTTLEEFDTFIGGQMGDGPGESKRDKEDRYTRLMNCSIIRSMINIHDTLISNRYAQVYEDRETLLEKLKASRLIIRPIGISWHYDIELNGGDGFQWVLMIDEKTFDSINKKKKSNRNYGNAEAMADLLRMRFEPKDRDEGMMLRAIDFFSTHIFAGKVGLKQKGELIPLDKLVPRKKATIATDLIKETTVSSLNNATLTGSVNQNGVITNKIECQFQFTGEMEQWVNTSLMYDLKKDLTAAARDLGSIDIQNVLFYIRKMGPENIWMTEQEIIDHLFFPDAALQNTSSRKRTPQEEKEVKAKLTLIEQIWRGPIGFLLPVRTKKWGIRFMTRMSFSQEVFELYKGQYIPAPWHPEKSPELLTKMVANTSNTVDIRLKEYQERIERTEPIRLSILRKYMQSPI